VPSLVEKLTAIVSELPPTRMAVTVAVPPFSLTLKVEDRNYTVP
jgi:hypothetical protein